MDQADDLRLALEISDRAARLALTYFEVGVRATLKADGTPVTEADRAVERLVRTELATARPDDALVGEELGSQGDSERVWIVDPIDGTSFFSRQDPHWRVHLALQLAGRVEVAVVTAPALGRRWWARRGGGAFESSWPRDGVAPARLAVSTTATVSAARVDALDVASRDRLRPGDRPVPGSPLPLVELVRGEIDAFLVEGFHLWDHAPWILLVEEAGGRFTDPSGGSAGDRGGLYSNAPLHGGLVARLGYPDGGRR